MTLACRGVAGMVSLLALTVPVGPLPAEEWSRFRGPNGSGVSPSRGLPVEFGPDHNVHWAVEVPFGRSSPAFGRDRIFLTAMDGGSLVTLALDRWTGETVWRRTVERAEGAVVKADPQWGVLALNDLGDEIYATPAIVAGRLYVRTRGRLYCFAAPDSMD